MPVVPVGPNYSAVVDQEDFERVAAHSWCPHWSGGRKQKLYAQARVKIGDKWRGVLMHRFILGSLPGTKVDHKDGNGLNNSRSNLRYATAAQNQHNSGPRRGRYKGVSWHRQARKWVVHIGSNGKRFYLGLFESEEEAARAYDVKCRELHGEFARPNFRS